MPVPLACDVTALRASAHGTGANRNGSGAIVAVTTMGTKLQALVKEYGRLAVGVHIANSVSVYGAAVAVVHYGPSRAKSASHSLRGALF